MIKTSFALKVNSLSEFVLIGAAIALVSCAPTMMSTPEKTIETFIEGYRRGSEELVLSTLHESWGIAPIAYGENQTYRILEKLLVLETTDTTSKPGDLQIRVHRQFDDPGPSLIAQFWLRKINGEWKIIGYHAYPADSPEIKMR